MVETSSNSYSNIPGLVGPGLPVLDQTLLEELDRIRVVRKAYYSFPYFMQYIFPLSFRQWDGNRDDLGNILDGKERWRNPPEGAWVPAPHTLRWAKELQENKLTARLCARKHLKSTTLYGHVMWKLLRCQKYSFEGLYISYNETLAGYHTGMIKKLIRTNPYFQDVIDLTNADTILNYTWDLNSGVKFSVVPAGIGGFKRGRHPRVVWCDDILADPKNPLNITIIETISRTFFEDVMSLPQEGGELHLAGTPQDESDLFFQIKKRGRIKSESNPNGFLWRREPAITNWKSKKVVWENLFSYDRLMEIRDEILEKAFNKEYMVSPVRTEDAFFKRHELEAVVNEELDSQTILNTGNDVIAGWDLGKKRHPSHFCVFEMVGSKAVERYQVFWDNVDYTVQLGRVARIAERMGIDRCAYDATRGEFEVLAERGELPYFLEPIQYTIKSKQEMASALERRVVKKKIELINSERQISVMLQVSNDLKAVETDEGHGDSFWSIASAMYLAEDEDSDINPSVMVDIDEDYNGDEVEWEVWES